MILNKNNKNKNKMLLFGYSCVTVHNSPFFAHSPLRKIYLSMRNTATDSKSVSSNMLNKLLEMLYLEDNTLKVSPKLGLENVDQFTSFIKEIESFCLEISKLSERGYINNPNFNLSFALKLSNRIEKLCIDSHNKEVESFNSKVKSKSKRKKLLKYVPAGKNFEVSILLNTLYFNMIMMLLYFTTVILDKSMSLQNIVLRDDVKTDYENVKKNIIKMIHPGVRRNLVKRGISVTLNSIVGYDTEYYLKSSEKRENQLLSVQLASSSHMYLKIPKLNIAHLNRELFDIEEDMEKNLVGESVKIKMSRSCIEFLIHSIRVFLYEDDDELLKKLDKALFNKYSSHIEKGTASTVNTDNCVIYSLPKSEVVTLFKFVDSYKSSELITDSESFSCEIFEKSVTEFIEMLNSITNNEGISTKMNRSIDSCINKPCARMSYKFNNSSNQLSISFNRLLYICVHESGADFSILNDFDTFKENLDIVQKTFVTRGKPLVMEGCKSKIYIRDTKLLSPAGCKALSDLGKIYGESYRKIDIGEYRGNMLKLKNDNPELFEEYGTMDAIITHKHGVSMEEFYLKVGKTGVPLTMSTVSKSYVLEEWKKSGYGGYLLPKGLTVGNLISKLTPKLGRRVGLSNSLVPFITSYRGGRNESMMYGHESLEGKSHRWFDYDLISCYTTVMSILGHPDFNKAERLTNEMVIGMSERDLIFNYITLDVEFEYSDSVKYPGIPTRVDDNVDIYPLKGRSVITGVEYLVAKSSGCNIKVIEGVKIPFVTDSLDKGKGKGKDNQNGYSYKAPFRELIRVLQKMRRMHKKGTFYNYMWKELGNAIYGLIAMGISGKSAYDITSGTSIRVEGGVLSNPILASYITGFARAFISECIHNVHQLGGRVISVTTDGFITDIENLEEKLKQLDKNTNCFNVYRDLRRILTCDASEDELVSMTPEEISKVEESIDDTVLEVKHVEKSGIISWKTRGQLGYSSGISAATGFVTRGYDKEFLVDELKEIFDSDDKTFEFVQSGLRRANDLYKNGGHLTMVHKDRKYSLEYDNKRCIIDDNNTLLDSKPWTDIKEYSKIRLLKSVVNTPVYDGKAGVSTISKTYKSDIETGVRGFIKICLSDSKSELFGIPKEFFKSYASLIEFIHGYAPARCVKLTKSGISHLRHRNCITRAVPRNLVNVEFVNYIKEKFESFDSDKFFKEFSDERKKELKSLRDKKAEKIK